jgi:hypothetical protein
MKLFRSYTKVSIDFRFLNLQTLYNRLAKKKSLPEILLWLNLKPKAT